MRAATAALLGIILFLAPDRAASQGAADDVPRGIYVSTGAGASLLRDADIRGPASAADAEFKGAPTVMGAVGWRFGAHWRAEISLDYRRAEVDAVGGVAGEGDADSLGLMLNGYYNFRNRTPFSPYLGAGLGGARVGYDGVSPVAGSAVDDSDTVLAYQGIAGVEIRVSDRLSLFGDYRYAATGKPRFTTRAGTEVESEFSEHRVMLGVSWSFGGTDTARVTEEVSPPAPAPRRATARREFAPAPAPPAVAEQAPAADDGLAPGSHRIFFAWNDWSLTATGQEKLDAIVSGLPARRVTHIEAVGHADRSGAEAYNMTLSKRRAETVRAELIRQGVPEEWITIEWKGEAEPLIPTADGFRHPRNRRVEIVVRQNDGDSAPGRISLRR